MWNIQELYINCQQAVNTTCIYDLNIDTCSWEADLVVVWTMLFYKVRTALQVTLTTCHSLYFSDNDDIRSDSPNSILLQEAQVVCTKDTEVSLQA